MLKVCWFINTDAICWNCSEKDLIRVCIQRQEMGSSIWFKLSPSNYKNIYIRTRIKETDSQRVVWPDNIVHQKDIWCMQLQVIQFKQIKDLSDSKTHHW